MTSRLARLVFAPDQDPSNAQIAALDLINELNAERRISTPEVLVLIAGLVRMPVSYADLTPELLERFRPQGDVPKRVSRAEATSCNR